MKIVISTRPNQPSAVDVDGPREDEHGLDVEDHEEQGVDVVADVRLAEERQRVRARFVGDVLLVLRVGRAQQPGDPEHGADHHERGHDEDRDGQVLPVELGHARLRNRPGGKRRGVYAGAFFPGGIGQNCRLRHGASQVALGASMERWMQNARGAVADLRRMGTRLPLGGHSDGHRSGRSGARPRTAFVLSGGGNQGVAQVGMLRAVLERGIVPDVVIGTSAGALNGAAVAYSPNLTGVAQLEAVWTSLTAAEVFPGGKLSRAWNVVRRETHLFESDGLDDARRPRHARPIASPTSRCHCGSSPPTSTRGEEVVLVRGSAQARAARERRAARRVSRSWSTTAAASSTAASSNSVPLWHALRGPVDRVIVFNVSAGARRPRRALPARRRDDELHALPQPAVRPRAAQRSRRGSR